MCTFHICLPGGLSMDQYLDSWIYHLYILLGNSQFLFYRMMGALYAAARHFCPLISTLISYFFKDGKILPIKTNILTVSLVEL